MKISNIKHDNKLLAYIVRDFWEVEGQKFFGSEKDFLQVALMGFKPETTLKPHKHLPQEKTITKNQEVLIILKGEIEVFFYVDNEKVTSTILRGGDLIALLDEGHSFKMLSEVKLIEIKQGPYQGQELDKEFLDVQL